MLIHAFMPIPMQMSREIDVLVFFHDSAILKKHCVTIINSIEISQSVIVDQLAKQLSVRTQMISLALIEEEKIKVRWIKIFISGKKLTKIDIKLLSNG